MKRYDACFKQVQRALPNWVGGDIALYNDAPTTTHRDILDLIDRACLSQDEQLLEHESGQKGTKALLVLYDA
jgi:hypothetical protein